MDRDFERFTDKALDELDGAKDAYEVSPVAVLAQSAAGVMKSKRYGGQ